MNEYPSNSYTQKKEPEPVKELAPVVQHNVQVRKKTPLQKFADAFIAEDLQSVKTYVVKDLLIPGLKRMFLSSLEMLLNGKGYNRQKSQQAVTTVSYRDYYDKPKPQTPPSDYTSFEDLIYEDRGDAEYVRDQMIDILNRYRVVRVSDMFELSKRPSPFTANRYGWTDMTLAKVIPVSGGYMIKMPRAMPLD